MGATPYKQFGAGRFRVIVRTNKRGSATLYRFHKESDARSFAAETKGAVYAGATAKKNPRKTAKKAATKKAAAKRANPRKVAKKAAKKKAAKKVLNKSTKRKVVRRKPASAKVAGAGRKGRKVVQWKKGKRPAKRRKNSPAAISAAVEKYQEFHGRAPDVVKSFKDRETVDDTLSGLGKLVLLDVLAMNGQRVELGGFKGALLAQDIDGTQLHIVGGDQSVDVEAFGVRGERRYEMLGLVELVAYHTTKDHLGEEDGGTADYHHEFGENGGALPCLMYDTVDERLTLVGGDYRLLSVGIDD